MQAQPWLPPQHVLHGQFCHLFTSHSDLDHSGRAEAAQCEKRLLRKPGAPSAIPELTPRMKEFLHSLHSKATEKKLLQTQWRLPALPLGGGSGGGFLARHLRIYKVSSRLCWANLADTTSKYKVKGPGRAGQTFNHSTQEAEAGDSLHSSHI